MTNDTEKAERTHPESVQPRTPDPGVAGQLRRNLVAIISLVVAVSSLGYNTWRNEQSEANRNIRFAAFTVIRELGELQVLVDRNVFFAEMPEQQDWVTGFGQAALVRDLCMVMPAPAPDAGTQLFQVWKGNVRKLFVEDAANRRQAERVISEQIRATREAVLAVLKSLE